MQSNLSSNFIPFHITRKLFASKIFSYEYAKKKYNKRNKCCKTIILPFTKQISFAQQIFFIKKKSKTFCYSHPLVDSRSFISSKKKIFPQSRNIEPFHARYASIEELEESCNELSEEALSIHPRYRGGKPAISSR